MKVLKGVVLGLFVAGLVVAFSSVSFAQYSHSKGTMKASGNTTAVSQVVPPASKEIKKSAGWTEAEKKEHEQAQIKLFNDAASALQKTNPDIAAGLTKYASEEAQEKSEKKEELEGKAEQEMEGRTAANLKLMRDAASALKPISPALSESLTKIADKKAQKMEMKKEGKEDTKENEAKEMKEVPSNK